MTNILSYFSQRAKDGEVDEPHVAPDAQVPNPVLAEHGLYDINRLQDVWRI